jgi:hypothetical protein
MARRSIHILEMSKHFLYLPIYYAHDQDFFGFLPSDIAIVIEPCEDRTDNATYDQMMDSTPRYRDYEMAITDPIQVLRTPLTSIRKPAILATLVTNAAFWAVNHAEHSVRGFRDLGAFDRVIAYAPGTTSHNIALRIGRDSGNAHQLIDVVEPGKELLRLTAGAMGQHAVALSPDLLHIEEMTSLGAASLELNLGNTPEYNDVLVTTLISHNEFVRQNEPIVYGLLRAIQRALLLTRQRHPDVIRFAQEYFLFADRAEGAVSKAIESEVFPLGVQTTRAHWLNAAKAYSESTRSGAVWSGADERHAVDYYSECVEPYKKYSDFNVADLTENLPRKVKQDHWTPIMLASVALATVGATAWLGWKAAIVFAVGVALAWSVMMLATKPRFLRWLLGGVFALGLLTIAVAFMYPLVKNDSLRDLLLASGISFVLVAVVEYAKHAKEL